MRVTTLAASVFAACVTDVSTIADCEEERSDLDPSREGSVGVAPVDVVAAATGTLMVVSLHDSRDGALPLPYSMELAVDVASDGGAEEVTRSQGRGEFNTSCPVGTFVAVPVTVAFTSEDEVWQISGSATLEASSAAPADIRWTETEFLLDAATDAVEQDRARIEAACGPARSLGQLHLDGTVASGPFDLQIGDPVCAVEQYRGSYAGSGS